MTAHVEGFTVPPHSGWQSRPMEHYWQDIPGGFWYLSAYMKLLEDLPKDRTTIWAEVGVFHGQSIAWLGVEDNNRIARGEPPIIIHAIDNFAGWPGVAQGEELRESFTFNTARIATALNQCCGGECKTHGAFHVTAKPSVEAAAQFPDEYFDVVWIDADHTYEGCKADIAAWFPKVRPGGFIGGDDWAYPGVRMATIEAFPNVLDIGSGERFQAPWPWWLVRREG